MLAGLPSGLLFIDGAALVALAVRESLRGSWLGCALAASLGVLFLLGAWRFENSRRVTRVK
jgi:hypothetical protein